MTRLLITIPTCHQYSGNPATTNRSESDRRAACRETWLKSSSVDYRLFYGRDPSVTQPDEISLACDDDYDGLSTKMRLMCRWALNQNYTHLFRVDTDAYVYTDRLLASGFEAHDYSGYTIDYPRHLAHARYASGAGFTLSERAMTIVADAQPEHPADDLWVGRILHRHGIPCHRDTRYLCGFQPHYIDIASLPQNHPYLVLHALTPDGIREMHRRGDAGEMTTPEKPLLEPEFNFSYGRKHSDCPCGYCKTI